MTSTTKRTLGVLITATAILGGIAWAQAPAASGPAVVIADSGAKASLEAYAKAINDRNYDAVAGFWAEDAEHIGDDGAVTKGKTAIAAMLKKVLTDSPKLSVKFTATAAKALGSDVLLIDGTAAIANDGDTDVSRFESLWVKAGTGWQLSRVRELANVAGGGESNYERLKELEWLIGDWSSDNNAYSISLNAKWGKNKNFIIVEQSVKSSGSEVVTVHKIIGWDPANAQLRTWVFDSDGGFGGALLAREGNAWYEASESLTRNGGEATANHLTQYIDDNTFEWSSTERQLDEKPLPDLKLKYSRKK